MADVWARCEGRGHIFPLVVEDARLRIPERLARPRGVLPARMLLIFMKEIRKIHIFSGMTVSQSARRWKQECDCPEVARSWSACRRKIEEEREGAREGERYT